MKRVKITVIKMCLYDDLVEKFEQDLSKKCDLKLGDSFISVDAKKPAGFCDSAWDTLSPFVLRLANGEKDLFKNWMKNPYSGIFSCNDGVRPVSFLIEALED